MNPEQSVVSEIDRLVDQSLAQPIVDDYSVNRYESCELCGNDWHGLPAYVEEEQRSCPGAWASDEAKALWRTMFQRPQRVKKSKLVPTTRAGRWTITRSAMSGIIDGTVDLGGDTFKVALFQSDIDLDFYPPLDGEVPNGNGYTDGGISVSLAWTRYGTRTEWTLTCNPVWTATGQGFTARHAVLYDTVSDMVLLHCRLSMGNDVIILGGNTLTIDGDCTPILILETDQDDARFR